MLLNRFLKYINSLIAVLLGLVLAAVYWYGYRVLPKTGGTIQAPISQAARVDRDARGVPHIRAATGEDALFLQGYVTAQDRLFQLELLRRQAGGTMAEVFGRRALESDLESRRLRMARMAERHAQNLPQSDRAAVAAYARGINYFLETHQRALPVEFSLLGISPAPWRIRDSVLVGLHMHRLLSIGWRQEIAKRELLAGGDEELVRFLFPMRDGAEPPAGSNAWVISGKHTASDRPLLAGDPHLPPAFPGIWYQVHIKAEAWNVAGVSLPGLPGVIIGHNERIAWAATNLGFDVQDLYRVSVGPGGTYFFQGRAEALVQERETVLVRGDRPMETVIMNTRHGPVLFTDGNQAFALRWTAAEPGGFAFPFLEINRARDWSEFQAALRRFPGPSQNFVYADVDGNIGCQVAGWLPVRRNHAGDLPADGTPGDYEWQGFIPFEELPSTFNPDSGIIVTANDNPFPVSYPWRVGGAFAAAYRARQIAARLQARGGWKPPDMLDIQKDVYSAFHLWLARQAVAAYRSRGRRNGDLDQAAALLEPWNGQMETGSPAPMLASLLYRNVRKEFVERAAPGKVDSYDFPMASSVLERLLRERPPRWFPNYEELLVRALAAAVREGSQLQGRNLSKWDYGRHNVARVPHPVMSELPWIGRFFGLPATLMSGASTTVKIATRRLAPSMRMVVDLGNLENSLMNIPFGQSGQPLSSHYRDQWEAHFTGRSFAMQFAKVEPAKSLRIEPTRE